MKMNGKDVILVTDYMFVGFFLRTPLETARRSLITNKSTTFVNNISKSETNF